MPFPKIAVLVGAGLLACTSAASAGVVTAAESGTYGPLPTNWGVPPPADLVDYFPVDAQAINFAGFDPSLGALQSVSLLITESLSGTLTPTNAASARARVVTYIDNTLTYQISGTEYSLEDKSVKNTAVLDPGQTGPTAKVTGSASTTLTFSSPSDLAFFKKAWSGLFSDSGSVNISDTSGNGNAVYTDVGAVSVQATYTFDEAAVSEPLSVALFGSGLVALGLVRRRR